MNIERSGKAVWNLVDGVYHLIIFAVSNELEALFLDEFIKNNEEFASYGPVFKSVNGAYTFYAPPRTYIGDIVAQIPPEIHGWAAPEEEINGQRFLVLHDEGAVGFMLIPITEDALKEVNLSEIATADTQAEVFEE